MGYTTEFSGRFKFNKPLTPELDAYLLAFAQTRRMKRNANIAAKMPDPKREAAGLDLGGEDAPYFTGGLGFYGQDIDKSVLDANEPPTGQPGLWCQWIPATVDGADGNVASYLEWDGGEKFYDYVEWLEYLIKHFLAPNGYVLNGSVRYRGEDFDDYGTLTCKNNEVILSSYV